ncbi:putative lipoprotein [Piscinibacter sakaiensis]|uniref:Putative lipoprotein n=1 Tax=Piscinibacter sakaiensis TaxID=1547922 RepID=A0A0K8P486_PISS1|nr:putative lipoprotein [Piscinibacter sakaiensis]
MRAWLAALFDGHPFGAAVSTAVGAGADGPLLSLGLAPADAARWAPCGDTLDLAQRLEAAGGPAGEPPATPAGPAPDERGALARETVAAWLLGPLPTTFGSLDALRSALRVRLRTVAAAARTALAFHTCAVERPSECWRYDEDHGFVILPGVSLIDALRRATQPAHGGRRYAFSCYRATEYVLLLALAEELAEVDPPVYLALEAAWRERAIASGRFHDVFLVETGSHDAPLPMGYLVPGDRVWFRNPDEASADASGYEGSWVVYLGGGRFANFWTLGQPYDLETKCLEIYHWRDATWRDADGELRVDEARVAEHVARTRADPARCAELLARMRRYRDGRGIYADGGCIDRTREHLVSAWPADSPLAERFGVRRGGAQRVAA